MGVTPRVKLLAGTYYEVPTLINEVAVLYPMTWFLRGTQQQNLPLFSLQAWQGPKDVYEINVEERVMVTHKRKLDDGYISCLSRVLGGSRGICIANVCTGSHESEFQRLLADQQAKRFAGRGRLVLENWGWDPKKLQAPRFNIGDQ